MTESEKNTSSRSTSRGSSNGTATRTRDRAAAASEDTAGALASLPAPLGEKTVAAAKAVRGSLGRAGWVWTAVRARKAAAAGAATATAAVVTTAYTLGRRSGLRRRGPLSRLTGGRL